MTDPPYERGTRRSAELTTVMTEVAVPDEKLTLERVVATLGSYPLPQTGIIPLLMRMTSDLNTGIDKVSRTLAADPSLAAKVVQLSNSPFYGVTRSVSSLNEAINILGFYTVRSLAIAASAYTLFRNDDDDLELEQDLWRHSLAVAIGARLTARSVGSRQIEEEAFLTGLLHDIAKLVLIQKFYGHYKPVLERCAGGDDGHIVVESELLGFNHADLGAIILDQWGFPKHMIGVVRRYHVPDMPYFIRGCEGLEPYDLALPHILCFAHEMAISLGYGFQEQYEIDLATLPSAEYLGLTSTTVGSLSRQLVLSYFEEQGFYAQAADSHGDDSSARH